MLFRHQKRAQNRYILAILLKIDHFGLYCDTYNFVTALRIFLGVGYDFFQPLNCKTHDFQINLKIATVRAHPLKFLTFGGLFQGFRAGLKKFVRPGKWPTEVIFFFKTSLLGLYFTKKNVLDHSHYHRRNYRLCIFFGT